MTNDKIISIGRWINAVEKQTTVKTKLWVIEPKDGSTAIGFVEWYKPWRKYCFFPYADTVYEENCLRSIAVFCENQTRLHKSRIAQPEPTLL